MKTFSWIDVASRAKKWGFVSVDTMEAVPEPAPLALFGRGIAGLGALRFFRRN